MDSTEIIEILSSDEEKEDSNPLDQPVDDPLGTTPTSTLPIKDENTRFILDDDSIEDITEISQPIKTKSNSPGLIELKNETICSPVQSLNAVRININLNKREKNNDIEIISDNVIEENIPSENQSITDKISANLSQNKTQNVSQNEDYYSIPKKIKLEPQSMHTDTKITKSDTSIKTNLNQSQSESNSKILIQNIPEQTTKTNLTNGIIKKEPFEENFEIPWTRPIMNSPPIYDFKRSPCKSSFGEWKRLSVSNLFSSPSKYSPTIDLVPLEEEYKEYAVGIGNSRKSEGNVSEFDVDEIIDHIEITPERIIYLVKWKGFNYTECTWEPLENLTNCINLIYQYKIKNQRNLQKVQTYISKLKKFLSQYNNNQLNNLLNKYKKSNGELCISKINDKIINKYLRIFCKHKHLIETNKCELNYIRELILTNVIYDRRKLQLDNLKRYEIEINVSIGNSAAPIYVINNVDLDIIPTEFTYTNFNIVTKDIIMNEDPVIYCDCIDNCKNSTNCCAQRNDSYTAYDENKKLIIQRGIPIYECNKNCSCNETCHNRVIQQGTQFKLGIFKTYNGCGWGVQALENIPKGTFVTEYIGEILTNKAASTRINQTYLFNLDFNNSTTYVIDACHYGNISHFINHSCDPNLCVYAAYIQCLDPNLHRLPLFAIRDIRKGEQLSFSYLKTHKRGRGHSGKLSRDLIKEKSSLLTKCKCGAENCVEFLDIS